MNTNNITIVENIRMIAASKKMNIAKIEKACGFANGTIGKWAKAPKSPPFDKIMSIADCLGVYIGDIVGYDYNLISDEPSTPEIKKSPTLSSEGELDAELIRRLIQLTPEEVAKVDAFVQGLLASH